MDEKAGSVEDAEQAIYPDDKIHLRMLLFFRI